MCGEIFTPLTVESSLKIIVYVMLLIYGEWSVSYLSFNTNTVFLTVFEIFDVYVYNYFEDQ